MPTAWRFPHGSGSGGLSSRNRFVAKALNDAGLATLLTRRSAPARPIHSMPWASYEDFQQTTDDEVRELLADVATDAVAVH